jgi:F-type H+-transporting ATPase subunit b
MATDTTAQVTEPAESPLREGTLVQPEQIPVEGHSVFPPFDGAAFASHLFWLAITFGILFYVTQRLIVPRVGGILEDRRDRVAGDHGEASRLKRETDEVIATYERELAEARQRAHGIAHERREEIKAELAQQRSETEAELQLKIAAAEETIAGLRDTAMADIDQIAVEAAQAIIARIAPVSVAEADLRGAVEAAKGAR